MAFRVPNSILNNSFVRSWIVQDKYTPNMTKEQRKILKKMLKAMLKEYKGWVLVEVDTPEAFVQITL